jgi:mRNA interferase MazF
VVVVQDYSFDATASITVCAFTTDETEAPLIRLRIEPIDNNSLHLASRLMADKITTVPKSKLGKRVGRLDDHILRLNQACRVLTINEPKRILRTLLNTYVDFNISVE